MPRELKPCGTRAAYQRHMKAGETPCAPCLEAMRESNRRFEESRSPRRRKPRVLKPCGTRAAYARHRRNGEKPCDACRAAESAATSSSARPARQRVRSVGPRIEQVSGMNDGMTCGNRVNLGTRTAPAERANVRGIRGLTTTPSGLSERTGL